MCLSLSRHPNLNSKRRARGAAWLVEGFLGICKVLGSIPAHPKLGIRYCSPLIPGLKRWMQEDWVFKVILNYTAGSRPAWTTEDAASKIKPNNKYPNKTMPSPSRKESRGLCFHYAEKETQGLYPRCKLRKKDQALHLVIHPLQMNKDLQHKATMLAPGITRSDLEADLNPSELTS